MLKAKNIKRLRIFVASLLLFMLFMVLGIKFTYHSIRKAEAAYQLSWAERSVVYIAKSLRLNAFEIFSHIASAGSIDGFALNDIPDGSFTYLESNTDKIPLKVAYHYYDKSEEALVVKLRNLMTNQTELRVLIDRETMLENAEEFKHYYSEKYDREGMKGSTVTEFSHFQHPVVLRDGSVIIRLTEYGPILRFDRNGNRKWIVYRSSHHSMEIGPDGHLWACSINPSKVDYDDPYIKDEILKVDVTTGNILWSKTVDEIMKANPRYDMSRFNGYLQDRYHINDVQPVHDDGRYWKKGDLFLSLAHLHTVLLYRPSTNKILWMNNTLWTHQHDVNVLSDKMISVFDNNSEFTLRGKRVLGPDSVSKLVIYDFEKDTAYSAFPHVFKKYDLYSMVEGRGKWHMQDSVLFLENSVKDQLVIFDMKKDKSYRFVVKSPVKNKVRFVTWARSYPLSYELKTE